MRVEKLLSEFKGDKVEARGKIGMRIGFLLALVEPNTPDDATRLERLRKAVAEVLNAKL